MSIRINFRKIAYFCMLFIFCSPPLFSAHPMFAKMNSALDVFRLFGFVAVIFYGISHGNRLKIMLRPVVWVSLFWGSQIIATVLNHGNMTNALFRFICMLSIICASYIAVKEHYSDYLETVTLYLSLICIINLASQIMCPEGIVAQISMHGVKTPIWFLGGENTMVSYIMPAMTLQSIRFAQTDRKVFLLLAALSAVSIVISGSATAIIGLVLFLTVLISALIFGTKKLSSVLNINTYLIIAGIAVVLFVIVGSFDIFRVIIVDLLGKDMTLTTRSKIWARIIPFIMEKPILGHGIMYVDVFRDYFGASHQHNYYLNILYQGGMSALMALFVLLNKSRKKLSLYKHKKEAYILAAGLFSFFVMFISEVYGDALLFYVLLVFSVLEKEKWKISERRQ